MPETEYRRTQEARFPLEFRDLQPERPRPCGFDGRLDVEIILRRRSVGFIHAMAIDETAVDHPAVARDEQSDVAPPCVARAERPWSTSGHAWLRLPRERDVAGQCSD